MPTHDSDPHWLSRAVESVRVQTYSRWELCVADDASSSPRVRETLEAFAHADARIRLAYRPVRGHISAASNSALAMAKGDFVALLDHDDELAPDALGRVATELARHPDADVVYSDEDKLDLRGRRIDAYFKPDFSPDLLLSQNVVSHLGVYRTELVRRAGGFREGFEGAQDHDLALRVLELSVPERVRHVPRVLYHWRTTRHSTSGGLWRKDYAHDAGCRAIAEHLARTGRRAQVERSLYSFYRVRYALPDPPPSVTVVAIEPLARSISRHPERLVAGQPAELVPVSPGAPGALAGRLGAAVRDSRGEVLVFLGPRCEPTPAWLEELMSQAARPEIGIVGGRILSPSRRVLHAGYLLCLDRDPPVVDAHRGLPAAAAGHFGRANLVQNLTAVSAQCLAMRREVFDALGGFDERSYPGGLFDVDLCLRARARGLRVLFTPHAAVVRPCDDDPSWPRLGTSEDRETLRRTWCERLPRDPCWHPAMDRRFGDFRLFP
jgi:GT2 family glycosyltransferase